MKLEKSLYGSMNHIMLRNNEFLMEKDRLSFTREPIKRSQFQA